MKALLHGALGGSLALALLGGCGSSLPLPPTGPHLPSDPAIVVPYPPPPARVEIVEVPEEPGGLVWIDGEWQWRSRRWAWLPGRWEPVPLGAYFAPATTVRRADGSLVWFAGAWHVPAKK
ncbi:hypothetical protein SOCEGT47_079150 [Sorangium cellulosum]|jgi:hypothetical protein|uniref:Uncharacterized protein n=1 Tax=Sorangium cellulosum TaxID=56 RepID=A0A4P2QD74_SORCE|nr:YXWGXW repeat-containing protein [Sorangium cellulosum]AUX27328.1 hypothetical protein SOCEGT47_079150 [Sorangium cellulosum]